MRKLLFLLTGLPVAIFLVLFAVANRASVMVSLDPFAAQTPALAFHVPLFVVVLLSLMAGVVVGGVASWLNQAGHRREARTQRAELRRLEERNAQQGHRPSLPSLPPLRS